jgi:predicted dehydrogenase
MLRVGLVGVGFMGWIHYLAYQRSNRAKLTAISTRDAKKRSGDWTDIKGNFGPPGEVVDLSECEVFDDWLQMIRSPNIDAIDICLPPAMHKSVAIAAMQAGKHVLCEKPIALTCDDANKMVDVACQTKRVLNVAHVLPYMGAFRYAIELARSNKFGKVRSAVLKRIISDPTWIPDFYNPKTVGGPMIDLHIHDAHFVQLLFGMPRRVTAAGWTQDSVAKYAQMLYQFDEPSLVASASSGVCTSAARGFTHGYEIQFERATITYELAAHTNGVESFGPLLYDDRGQATKIELAAQDEVDAFVAEITDFAMAIEGTLTNGSSLSAEYASNAVRICIGIEDSIRSGQCVEL